MHADFAGVPFALAVRRACGDGAACLESFEGEAAGAIVSCCDALEDVDGFGVFAFADEEFGGFFEPDYEDASHGHDEHKSSRGVPDIAPALVVGACASGCIVTTVVGKEAPREKAGDELSKTWRYLAGGSPVYDIYRSTIFRTYPTKQP